MPADFGRADDSSQVSRSHPALEKAILRAKGITEGTVITDKMAEAIQVLVAFAAEEGE